MPILSLGEFYELKVEDCPRFIEVMMKAFLRKMDIAKEFLEDKAKRLEFDILAMDDDKRSYHQQIFLQVVCQYGYRDIGIMLIWLMKVFVLDAGQSLLVPPGTLHCYIQGEVIEVMNNSDDTIRAGLTHKPKDTEMFLKLLNLRKKVKPLKIEMREGEQRFSGKISWCGLNVNDVSVLRYKDLCYPEL